MPHSRTTGIVPSSKCPIKQPGYSNGVPTFYRCGAGTKSHKEKAARRRLVLDHPSCLFRYGVGGIARCILHISRSIVGGTLGLIHLAFGLHFFVVGELTCTFFDGALGFISGTLHVLTIHARCPLLFERRDNERAVVFVPKGDPNFKWA